MTKSILAFLMFVILSGLSPQDQCHCRKPPTTPTGNSEEETDEPRDQNAIYKELYGQVTDANGNPVKDMTVEIYDHPEVVTEQAAREKLAAGEITQRKLASCKTGEEGMFCFEGISPGEYEVRVRDADYDRFTKRGPFETKSHVVTLDPFHPESVNEMIVIFLSLLI